MSGPTITVPVELFEWLQEYAHELKGEWDWKDGTTPSNQKDYDQLTKVIEEADALSKPTKIITEDLLQWLMEYAWDLRGYWASKNGSIPSEQREYDQLNKVLQEVEALMKSPSLEKPRPATYPTHTKFSTIDNPEDRHVIEDLARRMGWTDLLWKKWGLEGNPPDGNGYPDVFPPSEGNGNGVLWMMAWAVEHDLPEDIDVISRPESPEQPMVYSIYGHSRQRTTNPVRDLPMMFARELLDVMACNKIDRSPPRTITVTCTVSAPGGFQATKPIDIEIPADTDLDELKLAIRKPTPVGAWGVSMTWKPEELIPETEEG